MIVFFLLSYVSFLHSSSLKWLVFCCCCYCVFSVKRGLLQVLLSSLPQAYTVYTGYFSFDSFVLIVHNENESICEAPYKILLFYMLVSLNLNHRAVFFVQHK